MIDVTEKYDVKSKSIGTVRQKFKLQFPVTVKDGEVFQIQEDPAATFEQQTARKRLALSENHVSNHHKQTSKGSVPKPDTRKSQMLYEGRRLEGCSNGSGDSISGNSVERLLVVSLALKLEKIRDRAGSVVIDEVINLLNHKNFNLAVFKEMIKNSGHCQDITQDAIDQ